MKRSCLVIILLLILSVAYSQNFSNKGKDFYITYPAHIDGNGTSGSVMGIYITSDATATGTITVGTQTINFTVAANTVTRKFVGNVLTGMDASSSGVYLSQDDGITINGAIHVVSDNPVAVYAHIIRSARSGATLVLPTNVLGKEYVVPSYKSLGTSAGNGAVSVVAVEANTQIEITPTINSKNGLKTTGNKYTITLANAGDAYQLQFVAGGDISGTRIKSVSSSTGSCKKIAVFSSTTWSGFGCASIGSGDNLYQQLFPITSWGQNFATAPIKTRTSDIVRVYVNDATTVVNKTENGIVTTLTGLNAAGNYYEFSTGNPTYIQSDKPISVVQYMTTMACQAGASIGDPEMIILNPIEQTINNITVFSAYKSWVPTGQSNITNCYLNIIIKTNATSSFKINGLKPVASFKVIPGTAYSYLQEEVTYLAITNPVHTLTADSNFIAIAYGLGNVESYGYNAGTSVKDFTKIATFQNQYTRLDSAVACVNSPFKFAVPLSFQPTTIKWDFSAAPNITPTTMVGPISSPTYDSLSNLTGSTLYYYSTGNSYTFLNSNTASQRDTIKVYTTSATVDGCGSTDQTYSIPVTVSGLPIANYSLPPTICISDSIQFKDASGNLGTSSVITGLWTWGDGSTDSLFNPKHKYLLPNTYNIRYRPITNYGCIGDTTIPLTIDATAIAKFGYSDSCIGRTIIFTDSSTIASGTIAKWYWDYGDGTKDTLTTNASRTKIYTATGTYNVTLIVENATGCKSNPYTIPITIRPNAVVNFGIPSVVCLPIGAAQFTDSSTIADGTAATFKYQWSFGDGGIDSVKNPIHNYTATGSYNVKLIVKSQYGCLKDSTKQLVNIYTQPQVGFTVSPQVCLRDTTTVLTTQFSETGPSGATLTPAKYFWNFGDGSTDTVAYPKHKYAAKGVDTIKYWVISNVGCMSDTATQTTIVNPLPTANFITTAINNYCENKPITFTDKATDSSITTGVTINNWYWNMGNGTTLTPTGGFNTTFNQYYNAYGIYNVKMAVQNSIGCKSDTLTQAVTVNPQPHVGFIIPDVCLADASAVFTDTSTIANSNTIVSHLWNFNAGSPAISPGPTSTTPTAQNGSAHYNTVGNYIVSLKLISNNGCDTTLAQPFTVNGSIPNAQFTIIKPNNLCSNDSVRIIDASTVDFGNVTKNEIFWDLISAPAADSIDNNPSPQTSKQYAHLYNNFQTPATKTYSVKMIAHSGNSSVCQNSITKIITL
ncbi:MAG: PKD domain-containing protein, partial [Bacteroidetes bacterium]|nr:PKD domain-containing protein [Bacteroidota bacterium]